MTVITPGRYYILLETGRALEVASEVLKTNGAKIQTWKLYRGLSQLWEVKPASNGAFYLFNVGGSRALDAHDADVDRNGCRVQLYDFHAQNRNQQWIFQPLGSQRYSIRCAASRSNKVIQIKNNVIDRSGEAELADFAGTPSQAWRLVPANDAAIVQPNLVDLRPNQTPIKDQAARGSCAYFDVTAALEAAYKKSGYGDLNLSEEFWAIMGKALYIHPVWADIVDANYRENQFAGTGGGGSVLWYKSGFRIPKESDVPYRPSEYNIPNWDSRNQKEANDFNFTLFTPNVLRAPLYYGASSVAEFAQDQLRNSAEYERILSLGYEICVGTTSYGGPHKVLIVGFDKTNPAEPEFLIKNSWGPLGGDPKVHCERRSYQWVFDGIYSAEYLADVTEPSTWPELAFLGRWKLSFDGFRGTLDIYHIPGVGNLPTDTPNIVDRRIGVFYDTAGKAFRVNGSMAGNKIEFYFNGSKPNLPWDELSGRRFVYYLEPSLNIMTGTHHDGDGSSYGGYATKGSYIPHATPSTNTFSALANSVWDVLIGKRQGSARFGPVQGSSIKGVLSFTNGRQQNVEVNLLSQGSVTFRLEGSSSLATARFLNHEPGLLCGSTNDGQVFYAAFTANR